MVEDTAMTLADLEREGFSPAVLAAVKLLTLEKNIEIERTAKTSSKIHLYAILLANIL